MSGWVFFGVGMVVGACFGMYILALLIAARDRNWYGRGK